MVGEKGGKDWGVNELPGISGRTMLTVPGAMPHWGVESGLASLGSASRAVLLGATALVSVCAAVPASAQQQPHALKGRPYIRRVSP
jgi:hypothetical protein